MNGELCPQEEHAPQTVEGLAAWRACQRPGVWLRSGMTGVVTALDTSAALRLAALHGADDQEAVLDALGAIEAGAFAGIEKQRPKS